MAKTQSEFASPADVRAWAAKKGIEVKAGRIPFEVAEAFNAAHKSRKYVPRAFKPVGAVATVKGFAPAKNGRKVHVTKKVVVAEARAALQAQGVIQSDRGRLSRPHLLAYAGLTAE